MMKKDLEVALYLLKIFKAINNAEPLLSNWESRMKLWEKFPGDVEDRILDCSGVPQETFDVPGNLPVFNRDMYRLFIGNFGADKDMGEKEALAELEAMAKRGVGTTDDG